MPLTIRFTGPATLSSTLTITWAGGYPPGATVSVVETFTTYRTTYFQTAIGNTAAIQATNLYNALNVDYSANFIVTVIDTDVIITPRNGTSTISATTTSSNITINPMVNTIEFLGEPQVFVPAYNPVTYRFFSNNYAKPGYRYLVSIKDSFSSTIFNAKVAPQIDGSGYIDISKPVSNLLSYDFNPNISYNDAINSYKDLDIYFGEEYQNNWIFTRCVTATGATGSTTLGKCKLIQTPTTTAHTYIVGDQIQIDTDLATTNPLKVIDGLHTVVATSTYSITIDATKPSVGTFSMNGITAYADGRKTSYTGIYKKALSVFNGVRSWSKFVDWDAYQYYNVYASGDAPCFLITSLRPEESIKSEDDRFFMTTTQTLYMNIAVDKPEFEWLVTFNLLDKNGSSLDVLTQVIDTYGCKMKQFEINPYLLFDASSANINDIDSIRFYIIDNDDNVITKDYRVWIDRRCKIEDYELYFVDRMGSILSYAFQLRANEKGSINRETFKRQVTYNETNTASLYKNAYDLKDAGTTITNVNLSKELELNTNWMNNEMSLLFEELLTSPQVWIKIKEVDDVSVTGYKTYFAAVVVNETAFDVQKQKNKRLIRKTINVKMANENIINI